MPEKVSCPVEGFEKVFVTYPDRWTLYHQDQFYLGYNSAPEGASPAKKELYGTVALCEKFEGLDVSDIQGLDLHYWNFFRWLIDEVYGSYLKAFTTPPNS